MNIPQGWGCNANEHDLGFWQPWYAAMSTAKLREHLPLPGTISALLHIYMVSCFVGSLCLMMGSSIT